MIAKFWRAETGIFLGLWLYLSWLGQSQFLFDPGPFWSTQLGEQMLATGDVPRAETFSCTMPGKPWNSHQWLSQVMMALLHRIGGLDTLVFMTAILLAAFYTWVAHRLIRTGLHWFLAVIIVVLTVQASRYHFLARPLLGSIILMGWTFARLVDYEGGKLPLKSLYWLPLGFVLWTNLHGAALGGLATVSLVIAGWFMAWTLRLPGLIHGKREAITLTIILAFCWLATLVNPYGWELPRDWIALMGSPVLPKYIVEHQALDWANPYQLIVVVFGLVYVLILTNLTSCVLRVTWFLPVVWLVLSIQRMRHCTLFSITAAVALAEILPQTRMAAALKGMGSLLFVPPDEKTPSHAAGPLAFVLPALLVVTGLVCQAVGLQVPYLGCGWAQVDPGLTPLELAETINQRSQPGDAIFNDLALGGFLIYYAPDRRIFLDDRCELYGDPFLLDYFKTMIAYNDAQEQDLASLDRFERWDQRYHFKLALVIKSAGYDRYLASRTDHWTRIGATGGKASPHLRGAVLYERRGK